MIEPGAAAAVAASATQHIAVIATQGTINGGAYERAIRRLSGSARVVSCACSLFVALAEEGWINGPVAEGIARRYLEPLFCADDVPDTLVLGCTHFPVLRASIRAALPPGVKIVDSAVTTAAAALRLLRGAAQSPRTGAADDSGPRGSVTWLATDGAARFAQVGSIFLGEELCAEQVEMVDL